MSSSFAHSGRRRALLVGIEYTGTAYCMNRTKTDLHRVQSFLRQSLGVPESEMRLLTDINIGESGVRKMYPTRENIVSGLRWLSSSLPGDALFFYYVGQGAQVKDISGDEIDSRDEAIVPIDFETAGLLIDDEIYKTLVEPLPKGAHLTALADSPHSGSLLDLLYIHDPQGRGGVLRDRPGFTQRSPLTGLLISDCTWNARRKIKKEEPAGDVVLIAACKDHQSSAVLSTLESDTGSLTNAFLETIKNPNGQTLTYRSLLVTIREKMAQNGHVQLVQLSTSRQFSIDNKVVL